MMNFAYLTLVSTGHIEGFHRSQVSRISSLLGKLQLANPAN